MGGNSHADFDSGRSVQGFISIIIIISLSLFPFSGIIIFEDLKISQLCDMKYFIEIDKESCKTRRRDRVWDPEGSSWVENPQYFESIAWPQYLKSTEKLRSSKLDVKFLDSSRTSIEENFSILLQD